MSITIISDTERIIGQVKLNKELGGLKRVKNKERVKETRVKETRCPYCKIEMKLIFKDRHSSIVWHTCYDVLGNLLIGLEEELPKCPKCGEFLGATQTEFKGFYNDKGKLSKKDKHRHICPKCGWRSREYIGTFISR